jgi:hypothetical protein
MLRFYGTKLPWKTILRNFFVSPFALIQGMQKLFWPHILIFIGKFRPKRFHNIDSRRPPRLRPTSEPQRRPRPSHPALSAPLWERVRGARLFRRRRPTVSLRSPAVRQLRWFQGRTRAELANANASKFFPRFFYGNGVLGYLQFMP